MPLARGHCRVLGACTRENLQLKACVTCRDYIQLSMTLQQIAGKGSRTVQHAMPRLAVRLIYAEHRLGKQAGDGIERLAQSQAKMRDDANHRVHVEGTCEDRDGAQDGCLVLGEQRVAPLERDQEGPVAQWTAGAVPPQSAKSIIEFLEDDVSAPAWQTGRHQLDRERRAIQLSADFTNRPGVPVLDTIAPLLERPCREELRR